VAHFSGWTDNQIFYIFILKGAIRVFIALNKDSFLIFYNLLGYKIADKAGD